MSRPAQQQSVEWISKGDGLSVRSVRACHCLQTPAFMTTPSKKARTLAKMLPLKADAGRGRRLRKPPMARWRKTVARYSEWMRVPSRHTAREHDVPKAPIRRPALIWNRNVMQGNAPSKRVVAGSGPYSARLQCGDRWGPGLLEPSRRGSPPCISKQNQNQPGGTVSRFLDSVSVDCLIPSTSAIPVACAFVPVTPLKPAENFTKELSPFGML